MGKFSEFWQELRRKYEKRQNFFHNFEHGLNGIIYNIHYFLKVFKKLN